MKTQLDYMIKKFYPKWTQRENRNTKSPNTSYEIERGEIQIFKPYLCEEINCKLNLNLTLEEVNKVDAETYQKVADYIHEHVQLYHLVGVSADNQYELAREFWGN